MEEVKAPKIKVRRMVEYKPPVDPQITLETICKQYLWEYPLGDDKPDLRLIRKVLQDLIDWENARWQK